MAAAAIERAVPAAGSGSREETMTVLGAPTSPDPQMLAAVLGRPVRVALPAAGTDEVSLALAEAARATGPAWVVAVGSPPTARVGPARSGPGDGSIALLVDDGAGVPLSVLDRPIAQNGAQNAAFARLYALGEELRRAPGSGTGWSVDLRSGRRQPLPARGPALPSAPGVSQGAYVPTARYDESRPSRWRFLAQRCEACGVRTFPARARCRGCGGTDRLRSEPLPLRGATVVARTWIGPGGQPTEFDGQVEAWGAYGVVLAEIAPDARVTLMVADADPSDVQLGSTVDTELRRLYPMEGVWRYGRKAVPALPG